MNLATLLNPMINRTESTVSLYVGETFATASLVASTNDCGMGVSDLINYFGDCQVLEYSIGECSMHVLVKPELPELTALEECATMDILD